MPPTPPPPPLDRAFPPSDPLDCPPLRWGVVGCGRVSHDFCQALRHVPTARVVACAARDGARARAFAARHAIPAAAAHGEYGALLADPAVDAVYVGTVHAFRREIGEQCLLAGKHVLLEKPFCCQTADAEYLVRLAAERNLFLQEGMWTRFFPAVEQARRIVAEGLLGDVVSVASDFHFCAADSDEYPSSFVYQRKLGGGASLLVAPYPIAAVLLFFGGREPEKVKAVGQVDARTGVDLQAAVSMQFAPHVAVDVGGGGGVAPAAATAENGNALVAESPTPHLPGAGVATVCYGMLGESEEVTTVVGTKGRLTIHSPCHCPTRLTVQLKGQGRGNAAETLQYDFPLPPDTPEIVAAGGYFYPNSAGFCYEAAAVARCIAAGGGSSNNNAAASYCCPQFTLDETVIVQKILQEIRQQLNVKAVDED